MSEDRELTLGATLSTDHDTITLWVECQDSRTGKSFPVGTFYGAPPALIIETLSPRLTRDHGRECAPCAAWLAETRLT